MNILIADDNPQRYKKLEEIFQDNKSIINSFVYVTCAKDARISLAENTYDLLILDILLPFRVTDLPDSHIYSMDILHELNNRSEDCELKKPTHILGITGDVSAYESNEKYFENNFWSIVHYDQTSDEWAIKISNSIHYISDCNENTNNQSLIYDYDLVVVCALEEPELSAVRSLDWNWQPAKPIDHITFVYDGSFKSGTRSFKVAAVAADRMGMVESALLVARVIDKLKPRCIAMTGICAGVNGKVDLCDVILADPVWDYQSGKWAISSDGKRVFQTDSHQISIEPSIRAYAKQALTEEAISCLSKAYSSAPIKYRSKFRVGPIASGSAVLADGDMIMDILQQNRKLLGVEMEIYGVYAATQKSLLKPKMFAMKCVCDFANVGKEDDLQHYASYLSANSLRLLMERYAGEIIGF